ncbi:MAG: ribonuclease HII [Kiritimatiellia bacterium]|jgi:ribonuclease HII
MLALEQAFWKAHPGAVLAGVDEAGRGPLAGPVVAAAVSIPPEHAAELLATALAGLTDSKKLSARRREHFHDVLCATPGVSIGFGEAAAGEIDATDILRATHLAMRRAVDALPHPPDHALVDGLPPSGLPCPFTAIVKGDAKSLLIAAASVIAKVRRDRTLDELDARYPGYGFAGNKGYGTREHLDALRRLGPCPEHRRTFGPVRDVLERLPGLA